MLAPCFPLSRFAVLRRQRFAAQVSAVAQPLSPALRRVALPDVTQCASCYLFDEFVYVFFLSLFFWEGIWGCLVQSCTSPGSSLTPKVLFAPQQNKERQIQSLII